MYKRVLEGSEKVLGLYRMLINQGGVINVLDGSRSNTLAASSRVNGEIL